MGYLEKKLQAIMMVGFEKPNLMVSAFSSLAQCSIKAWDQTWAPLKANNGIYDDSWAVSVGNDDHIGRGFEVTFSSAKKVNNIKLYFGKWKVAKLKIEYFTTSWVLFTEYTVVQDGTLSDIILNNTTASSTKWRVYISANTATVANCYFYEVEMYE